MKASPFHDDPSERPGQGQENDPVWRLLGESPCPEPDAWFATRTMARCRQEKREARTIFLRGMWRWALGGGLSICLTVALLLSQFHPTSTVPDQNQKVQEAFEIVASLNVPDSDSSSSSWQDSSL
jgi:hypothetical protein